MTAGWSKGRKNYHLYYRCTEHTNYNIPGTKIHEAFEHMLKALSFQPHQLKLIKETSKLLSIEPIKLKNERHQQKLRDLKDSNDKIFKLEERLVNNEIETETYQRWNKKLKEEKGNLEYSMRNDNKSKLGSTDDIVERMLPELLNLQQIYEKGNITQKHTLIRGVFKDSLSWGEGMFRTTFIDPIFNDNLLKINKKGLLFYEQSSSFLDRNPFSTQ